MKFLGLVASCLTVGASTSCILAQPDLPSKVPLAFDRYRTVAEIDGSLRAIAAAYPDLCTLTKIGESLEGRDLLVLTIGTSKGAAIEDKPAMWIDGAVHANEIQSAEVVLYTAWYLTKAYGANRSLTDLVDRCSFHLMPLVNPDNRDVWLQGPATPNSQRSNRRPVDQDRDGQADEDGPDDLDGDGSITQMWKRDPLGRWERDAADPRIFRRVASDKPPGGWTPMGEEGIDNDGDGEINEDPTGGDDMNRNWPAGWLPEFAQGGAGPFPLSAPETRAVADFIEGRPNIAAVQSYHNTGGMILRGPGAEHRGWAYPASDVRVYDQLASVGEQLLPYYRSMVIHRDLYTVHGGFVNWTAESLGIFSFTNELWTPAKFFQRDRAQPDETQQWLWRDRMAFGQLFTEHREIEHPTLGKVLVGGLNKWSSRVTPTFMLLEECHRNFAFTMFHADQTPRVMLARHEALSIGPGLWQLTVELANDRIMPTRSEVSRDKGIGSPDLVTVTVPDGRVAAAFALDGWFDRSPTPVGHEPARVQLSGGVPGRGGVTLRFIIEAPPKASVEVRCVAEKAADLTATLSLTP
ncbi:MAG: M14 family metallopeptidase [Phycisphaerales bacterium]